MSDDYTENNKSYFAHFPIKASLALSSWHT